MTGLAPSARAANSLLWRLWTQRAVYFPRATTRAEIFPLDLTAVAKALGVEVETVEMIGDGTAEPGLVPIETAGMLEVRGGKAVITIAQKFPLDWRRFTLAHEFGHVVLGHGSKGSGVIHRDRPLTGAESSESMRSPIEREANEFAANLLMPSGLLRTEYLARFCSPIDPQRLDETHRFWLPASQDEAERNRFLNVREYRAYRVASACAFNGRQFTSLAARFGVSKTAMAIRLEKVGLVR